jgi:AcrR family transcriptional regulator
MAKKASKILDKSTEEKIKSAARLLFQQKGFAATRTRDIAQESGINLALLNYYFRSKEKLFELIMMEALTGFFAVLKSIINDPDSSFEDKLDLLVDTYITRLLVNEDIPMFILSEIRSNPKALLKVINAERLMIDSVFIHQLQKQIEAGVYKPIHPNHFLMNFMGLTVFPFIAKPMILHLGDGNETEFRKHLEERKRLIPIWIKALLNT